MLAPAPAIRSDAPREGQISTADAGEALGVNDSDFNLKAMKVFSSGEVLWSRREPQCSANNADLNSGT